MALTGQAQRRQRHVFDTLTARWDSRRYQFLKEIDYGTRGGIMHNRDIHIAKQAMIEADSVTGLHIFDDTAKWDTFETELAIPPTEFYDRISYVLWYAVRGGNGARNNMDRNFYKAVVRVADNAYTPELVPEATFPGFLTISNEDVYRTLGFSGGTSHYIKGMVL